MTDHIRSRMRDGIRARGKGYWEIKLEAGPRDPATGKRKIKYVGFRGTRAEAKVQRAELVAAVGRGSYISPSRVTVAALIEERIRIWEASGRISAKTAERRRQLAKSQIGLIGQILVQKLATGAIEHWHANMLTGGLAPRTIRDAHSLLAQSFDEAMRHRVVLSNPARLQRPPKIPHEEVEIIPADEIAPTLTKLENDPFYVPVVVALYCGARRGEQLSLTWADVDFNAKTLRIERALEETKAGLKIVPTKSRRARTITLPLVVVAALEDHRRQQLELRMALGLGKPAADALIFPGHDFGHQSPRNFSVRWQRTVKRLSLPPIRWHGWRHTCASLLIDAKVDITVIAKRLGHASPAITLGTYSHCFKRDDRAAADAIDALGWQ